MKLFTSDSLAIWINVLIAFVLLPAYFYLGEYFKYIIAPYVIYLVWSRDPRFFPALIIHIIPGTTISNLILILCLILTITNLEKLTKMGLKTILFWTLIPLPIFIGIIFFKFYFLDHGFIEVVASLSFYLGLFPFFYGVLISNEFSTKIWMAIITVLFMTTLLTTIPDLDFKIRHFWFSFPLFITITFVVLLNSRFKRKIDNLSIAISMSVVILIMIIRQTGLKFTLLFSGFLSSMILIFYYFQVRLILKWIIKPRVILLVILTTITIIILSTNYEGNLKDLEGQNLFEMENPVGYLMYKALGDRGALWKGGWEFLMRENLFWPPNRVPDYSFTNSYGSTIENVEFGIHNLGLELMRNYGIVVGGIILISYLLMLTRSGRIFNNRIQNVYVLIFSATVLGSGIVGALVGQYPLMNTFSFLLLGIAGITYTQSLEKQKYIDD